MSTIDTQSIRRSLRVQSTLSMLLAGCLLLVGPVAAYSSLFGSLAAFIPNMLFAMMVAPKIGPDSAVFLRTVVIAETVKLLLIAVICILVIVFVKPLAPGWFFAGMVLVIFSARFALAFKK